MTSPPAPPRAAPPDASLGDRMDAASAGLPALASGCMENVFGSTRSACSGSDVPVFKYIFSTSWANESAVIASNHLYPCPIPYDWFVVQPSFTSRRSRQRWKYRRAVELLVNFCVASLSHIALGFPWKAPVGGRVGLSLNSAQTGLVAMVTGRIRSMGRFLTKSERGPSMEKLVQAGDSMSECIRAIELIPYSRLRTKSPGPSSMGTGLACGSRPGPLVADRIDFPSDLSMFDPRPFLSEASIEGLYKPDSLLKDDSELDRTIPRGRMATRKELFKLGLKWDRVGKAALMRAADIDERDIADIFPVAKSGEAFPGPGVDRQIIDRRRRNARERRVVTGSRDMPNAALLCDLHVPAGFAARISADDLRNFYHAIPGLGGERGLAVVTQLGCS